MDQPDDLDRLCTELVDATLALVAEIPLRPTTRGLVINLLLDLPLSPVQRDDFGVTTPDHARALQAVLGTQDRPWCETVLALDRCLGDGDALTALVHELAPDYRALRFVTVWDTLRLP